MSTSAWGLVVFVAAVVALPGLMWLSFYRMDHDGMNPWNPLQRAKARHERRRASLVASYVDLGMSPDMAAGLVDEQINRESTAAREIVEALR